jgi:hypothetical protein
MFRHHQNAILAAVTLSATVFSPSSSRAQGNNPGVVPPQAKFHGLSYGEWEAKWWQAAAAIPAGPDHPFFVGGAFGNEKGVLFLAGVGGTTTVFITIPSGTALFFPLVNSECSSLEGPPFHGATEAEQRACANGFIDQVTGVFAVIDGRPVSNIPNYRTQSPQFTIRVPPVNILGVPGPAAGTSVDAGYYLLLSPLSVGTHMLRFGGTFPPGFGDFTIDTTYVITVVPGR